MKRTIEISDKLYSYLEEKAKFGETVNDVISRLVGFQSEAETSLGQGPRKFNVISLNKPIPKRTVSTLRIKGIDFWEGMRLHATYKGRQYEATVNGGRIVCDGKKFGSPSAVAGYICGNPVNGWKFWNYLDESGQNWKSLDYLRN